MTGVLGGHAPLRLTVVRSEQRTVVGAVGELDIATADEFAGGLRAVLAIAAVLLDLSELSFVDSSGLRALDRRARRCRA